MPRERRFRRFNLEQLVHVRFDSGNAKAEVDAVTKNICLGGLLLESACLIPCGSSVEFTIGLQRGPMSPLLKLTGSGKVVRVEPAETAGGFGIAVECSQPITE
jgi:PilZ domain-containing protein